MTIVNLLKDNIDIFYQTSENKWGLIEVQNSNSELKEEDSNLSDLSTLIKIAKEKKIKKNL